MPLNYNQIAGQSAERLAALSDGIFAVAIPLLVSLLPDVRRTLRAATAAGAVVVLSALLLTESRGALVALAVALAVQLALDRRGEFYPAA